MKNRLKHNQKFCKVGETFEFVKINLAKNTGNIFVGRCVKIYKSYTTQYRFNIKEYTPSYEIVSSRNKNIKRPTLNNFYKDGNVVEASNSLLAKIKLMERK
ncbi:MAG: hypothetical protein ACOCP4_07305 [Candidatus Woesearchaeota archaeon]